ncbi:hypothetical protein GCM10029964_013990 [Kibdelosporangium lantanae]
MLEATTISNGVGWSPDNTLMYFADTHTGVIDVLDFSLTTGEVRNRRPFVDVPGSPTGCASTPTGACGRPCGARGGSAVHAFGTVGPYDHVPGRAHDRLRVRRGGVDGPLRDHGP